MSVHMIGVCEVLIKHSFKRHPMADELPRFVSMSFEEIVDVANLLLIWTDIALSRLLAFVLDSRAQFGHGRQRFGLETDMQRYQWSIIIQRGATESPLIF